MIEFVRYQSAVPNRNGRYPGVFALANGLRHHGLLTDEDAEWHREANRRATAAYVDPTTVDPDCYDQSRNPGAKAWFAGEAVDLLALTDPYLDLLGRYNAPWVRITSRTPGQIVYRDDVQIVAVPHTYPADRRSLTSRQPIVYWTPNGRSAGTPQGEWNRGSVDTWQLQARSQQPTPHAPRRGVPGSLARR